MEMNNHLHNSVVIRRGSDSNTFIHKSERSCHGESTVTFSSSWLKRLPLFPARFAETAPDLSGFSLSVRCFSASTFHSAVKNAKASHRPPGGQLGEAEVRGQRQPPARHRVAEGQPAAAGRAKRSGRRGRQEEEVDAESEEPDAGAEREVHVPCVQQSRGDQRHIQSGGHT